MSLDENMSGKKLAVYLSIGILYYFILTLIGVMVVTIYSYFYLIEMNSLSSNLIMTLIFILVLFIDTMLVIFNKPSPTLIVILIAISPILVLYRLIENTDLIQIDKNVPVRLYKFVPPKFIR